MFLPSLNHQPGMPRFAAQFEGAPIPSLTVDDISTYLRIAPVALHLPSAMLDARQALRGVWFAYTGNNPATTHPGF